MPDKGHVVIIIITTQGQTVQNFEHFIDRSFSRAKWLKCGLQIHLQLAKRNDLVRAVLYLAVRSDDNMLLFTTHLGHCCILIYGDYYMLGE